MFDNWRVLCYLLSQRLILLLGQTAALYLLYSVTLYLDIVYTSVKDHSMQYLYCHRSLKQNKRSICAALVRRTSQKSGCMRRQKLYLDLLRAQQPT